MQEEEEEKLNAPFHKLHLKDLWYGHFVTSNMVYCAPYKYLPQPIEMTTNYICTICQ